MTFRVVIQRLARRDLNEAYRRAARRAPQTAGRWLTRFQAGLSTLETNPERCPIAPESSKMPIALREYLFGKRPHVFRVVFVIDGDCVRILRIRRAHRRLLSRKELGDAFDDSP